MVGQLSALEQLVLGAVRRTQLDAQTPAVETAIAANVPGVNAELIRGYLLRFESAGYVCVTRSPTGAWSARCTATGHLALYRAG